MSGQHPFEGIVEKFFDGTYQHMLSPYQLTGGTEPPLAGVPPEMIPREEKPVLIEQSHAACCVAWDRNDLELRHDLDTLCPFNDPFHIRGGFDVGPMYDPFRAEMGG